jgi:hypothetical protein
VFCINATTNPRIGEDFSITTKKLSLAPADSAPIVHALTSCCRHRYVLGRTVVGTFAVLEVRVQTFDYRGLENGGMVRRDPLGGVVAKL